MAYVMGFEPVKEGVPDLPTLNELVELRARVTQEARGKVSSASHSHLSTVHTMKGVFTRW